MSTQVFKAGYLPGLQDTDVSWHRLSLGMPHAPLRVDVPQLSSAQMPALAQRVQHASQTHLKTMSVSDIVRVLDKVTARLLDSRDVYRQQLERLLPQATGFDAEMVRLNGYSTAFFGKNHETAPWEVSPSGPTDRWPVRSGFDKFYGFFGGETDQWTPYLFRNTTAVFPWVGQKDYNLITDMADDAIRHIRDLNAEIGRAHV